jgi:hypothetical protein
MSTPETTDSLPMQPLGLVTRDAMPVARLAPTPADMMQAMIDKGVTQENAAAFRELVLLSEHMEDRKAKSEFAADFMALQAELPRVQATKVIPDKNGNMRSSFAPFEEIDTQLRPIAQRHGFTYSFSEGLFQAGKITKICTVLHRCGHERSNPFSVRVGNGPPGCSEAQADGAAHSYAKRGALCDAFNIVVHGIDNDARLEGDTMTPVSKAQADELERRAKMTNSNLPAFLKLAGSATFAGIPASKYEMLDGMLRKKESQSR